MSSIRTLIQIKEHVHAAELLAYGLQGTDRQGQDAAVLLAQLADLKRFLSAQIRRAEQQEQLGAHD